MYLHIKLKKIIGILLSIGVLLVYYSSPVRIYNDLPKEIIIFKGEDYDLKFGLPVKYKINNKDTDVLFMNDEFETSAIINTKENSEISLSLSVFGIFIKKKIRIKTLDETYLILGGDSIGVALKTEGVLVVGFCDIVDNDGNMISPSKKSGLQIGDAIIKADGRKITTANSLSEIIEKSEGKIIDIEINRSNKIIHLEITAKKDYIDDKYHIGIWAREGSSGIGTLTYINPATNKFGALGHPVTDNDTGGILDLAEGWLYKSKISAIYKGTPGMPGELMGQFYKTNKHLANIEINCKHGLFGEYFGDYDLKKMIKILPKNDVIIGPAKIITTLDADGPKEYECKIEKINSYKQDTTKNIVIKITDEKLLELTGGIVQGMSGSPILQDGKLLGAVTHVFVNDPTMGHAVFIENMLIAQENQGN